MRLNPIEYSDIPSLPDEVDICDMRLDSSIHRPMDSLFWMALHFWDMVDNVDDRYQGGYDAGYAQGQEDARKVADDE